MKKKRIPEGFLEAPLQNYALLDLQIEYHRQKRMIKEARTKLEDYCVTCIQSGKYLGEDPLVYRQSKVFNQLIEEFFAIVSRWISLM